MSSRFSCLSERFSFNDLLGFFDLLYRRLAFVFIGRGDGPDARRTIGNLGSTLDASTVAVIFPEGRLYRPELLTRIQAKLCDSDSQRAQRVARLRHVLRSARAA